MKTTMYKYLFPIAILTFAFGQAFSQRSKIYENPNYGPDSASRMECASNLSIMNQYCKINTLEYAYDSWKYCYTNCPQASKNIYIHGAKILKYKIENASEESVADAWVDTLMMMYDQRIKYF